MNSCFPVIRTIDGTTWQDIGNNLPAALPGEFSFASSGTGLDGDSPPRLPPHRRLGRPRGNHHGHLPHSEAVSRYLFTEMAARNRIETWIWDFYDTRHVAYRPSCMSPEELKREYDWAYQEFYRWWSIFEAASAHESLKHRLKHFFYSAGWKKFERACDTVIRIKQLSQMRPLLEAVLAPVQPSIAALAPEDLPEKPLELRASRSSNRRPRRHFETKLGYCADRYTRT